MCKLLQIYNYKLQVLQPFFKIIDTFSLSHCVYDANPYNLCDTIMIEILTQIYI